MRDIIDKHTESSMFCSLNYTKYAFCIILYVKNTIPLNMVFKIPTKYFTYISESSL